MSYNPAIQLMGIYLDKAFIQKINAPPIFIAVLFTVAKIWKNLNDYQLMNGLRCGTYTQ